MVGSFGPGGAGRRVLFRKNPLDFKTVLTRNSNPQNAQCGAHKSPPPGWGQSDVGKAPPAASRSSCLFQLCHMGHDKVGFLRSTVFAAGHGN